MRSHLVTIDERSHVNCVEWDSSIFSKRARFDSEHVMPNMFWSTELLIKLSLRVLHLRMRVMRPVTSQRLGRYATESGEDITVTVTPPTLDQFESEKYP